MRDFSVKSPFHQLPLFLLVCPPHEHSLTVSELSVFRSRNTSPFSVGFFSPLPFDRNGQLADRPGPGYRPFFFPSPQVLCFSRSSSQACFFPCDIRFPYKTPPPFPFPQRKRESRPFLYRHERRFFFTRRHRVLKVRGIDEPDARHMDNSLFPLLFRNTFLPG